MNLKTIRVTWMNELKEVYEDVTTTVSDGVLHIHQYVGSAKMLYDEWHIPINNIRLWKPLKPEQDK